MSGSAVADGHPVTPPHVAARLAELVVGVPDFPVPGVLFRDISPLLASPGPFAECVDALAALAGGPVDVVAGIEARGFALAAPVAVRLGAGFVPIRKAGKLPRAVHEEHYDLEYGTATLAVHQDAVRPGERVLLVDDVLATGGTARAAESLLRRCGADVVAVAVLLEISDLGGRAVLDGGSAVRSVLAF